MFTILGLVFSHATVAVLAVLWGKRHPSTVASAVSAAATAKSDVTNTVATVKSL
jgi:hypothetical protein